MTKLTTILGENEWEALVDLYEATDMFLGLGAARETDKIRRAYLKSHKYCVAWQDGKIVGAARMISDGECYGWIHDMAVLPELRHQGIGRLIIDELYRGNESLLVGLTSSFEAVEFYQKLGFNKHKTAMAKYPGYSDYLYYEKTEA